MKILLVQTGFLGDVILSTPVIRAVHELFPEASLSFLTTPAARELVADHPLLSETLVFAKRGNQAGWSGLLQMAKELRSKSFDIAISLHKSARTAVLLRLAGIALRYGFREAAFRSWYTKTAPRKDLPHDVLRNLAILRVFDREPRTFLGRLEVALGQAQCEEAQTLLAQFAGKRIVAIAPGSVWLTKRWVESGFRAVVEGMIERGFAVVVLGGPTDRAVAEQVVAGLPGSVVNLAGGCSLLTSAAIISQCELLVSNDSAPLHLGSAFKVPTVALFCATVPDFGFGPWQNSHEILGVDGLNCRPCGRHGGLQCPTGTHACRLGITPAAVLAACDRLLTEKAA